MVDVAVAVGLNADGINILEKFWASDELVGNNIFRGECGIVVKNDFKKR